MKTSLTKKVAYMVMLGVVPLAAGFIIKQGFFIFILYNILILCLALVDANKLPSQKEILIKREHERNLKMGVDNSIRIDIENLSNKHLYLTIRDMVPDDICRGLRIMNRWIGSRSQGEVQYSVHPMKRGNFLFGDMYIKIRGIMGLVEREYRYDAGESISVYPDLSSMKKHRLLAKHMLRGSGSRRRRIQGIALDFRGLRDYCFDDEYRRINWNASARVFKPITNIYDIEKSQNIIMAIDTGRTMFDSYKGFSRLDWSVASALILAKIAEDRGDKTGLAVFSSSVDIFIKPDKGIMHQEQLVNACYGVQPGYYESDLKGVVSHLSTVYRKRSLICIFSALPDSEGAKDLLEDLMILKKRHGILFVSPENPGIMEMAGEKAGDMADVYRKAAAVRAKQQKEAAIRILSSSGIPVVSARPQDLTASVTALYTALRSKVGYA